MQTVTIGKRLVPIDQISFVEAFDPDRNPDFKTDKAFKGRVVLLNRDTVLTETTPQDFAAAHGLYWLAEDSIAISKTRTFRVEIFEPTDSFQPSKAYRTRLKWTDLDGNEQSKLLVAEPETVIAELSRRQTEARASVKGSPRRPARARRRSIKEEPVQR